MNATGQRTQVSHTGPAFASARDITWGYDALGQVTKADSTVPGLDRAYQYDLIGNRMKSADSLTLPATNNYTANAVNQYTAVGALTPSYDDDGNMTSGPLPANVNANSTLIWDGENRLIQAQVSGGNTVTCAYDSQSRRISETVGSATTVYVYDEWNPVAEYSWSVGVSPTLTKTYTWGLDLSGSMRGAGGVGGLLSVTDGTGTYFPTFDGNGNVSEYLDGTGTVVAHYEYDPFGRTTVSTGTKAQDFAHRFSTKPLDATTGLYYYGYRYYDPQTGRWPSRDPIEEMGGVNLYGFVGNCPVRFKDILGMGKMIEVEGHKGWKFRFDYGAGQGGGNASDPSHFQFSCKKKDVLRRVYLDGSQKKHGSTGLDKDVPEAVWKQAFKQKRKSIVSSAKIKIRDSKKPGGGRGALGLFGVAIILNEMSGANDQVYRDMKMAVNAFESGDATNGDAITIAVAIQQITGNSFGSIAVYDALNKYEN